MSHPSRWLPIGQIALKQNSDGLLAVTTFYVDWREIKFKSIRWTHTADESGKTYVYERGIDQMIKQYKELISRDGNPHSVVEPLMSKAGIRALIEMSRRRSQRTNEYFDKAS